MADEQPAGLGHGEPPVTSAASSTPPPVGEPSATSGSGPTLSDGIEPQKKDEGKSQSDEAVALDKAKADKQLLEEKSAELRASIASRSVPLIDAHNILVFDVYHAYLNKEGMATMVSSLMAESREDILFSRLRLLAVLSHHPDFQLHADSDVQHELMGALVNLQPPVGSASPKWLSANMLCAEALFVWGETIKPADKSAEEGTEEIIQSSLHAEARQPFATQALRLLRKEDVTGEELLAALRLLVLLTRDHDIAAELVHSEGLRTLMDSLSRAANNQLQACQSMVTMIMRHCAEDKTMLQIIMGKEIRAWFARPRNPQSQVAYFVSNIRQTALRDPSTFVKAVEEECNLRVPPNTTATAPTTAAYLQIKVPADAANQAKDTKSGLLADKEMQVDDPFQEGLPHNRRGTDAHPVLRFLVDEIASIGKYQDNPAKAEGTPRQGHESTTLLIFTELLGSYIDVKTAFVTAGRRSGKEPLGKHRPVPTLNILINELVCSLIFDVDICRKEGSIPSPEQMRRVNLSNWSSASIVALCADASASTAIDKDGAAEMTNVRRIVMEAIAKALKDAMASTEAINLRVQDESTLHIAKVMLEKNFVPLLTASLVDIDLQYPGVKNLATSILLPLEHLTKLSTRMGKTDRAKGERTAHDADLTSESESDDSEDGFDASTEPVEGAPDLYRNSALGMFAGAADEFMTNSDDEDGEGEDGADEFDEMDDMEEENDSDGTEPSDEDEGDTEHEMDQWEDVDVDEDMGDENNVDAFGRGNAIGGSGEPALGIDGIGIDGMHDEDDPDDMDDMDEDDFDDQGDDEDGDDYDEVDEDDQVSVYHELEMDAGLVATGGDLPAAGATQNWGWAAQGQTSSEEDGGRGQGTGYRRGHHHRFFHDDDADVAMFGRLRSHPRDPPSGSASISNHPLLQEHERSASNVASVGLPPGLASSLGVDPSGHSDLGALLQAIDHMMGGRGQAMHMLEGLANRAGPGGQVPDGIRIDLDQGPGGRSSIGIQLGPNGIEVTGAPLGLGLPRPASTQSRLAASGIESVPQPTSSRWLEEEKIAVPVGSTARIAAIAEVILQRMLPDARQAEESRKSAEAARAAKRREEEKAEAERLEEVDRNLLADQAEAEAANQAATAITEQPADIEMTAGDDDSPAVPSPLADASEPELDAPRVTIMIHGEEVDITETGIDPEFLEALPDDMRADVVDQHIRDRRILQGDGADSGASEISPEFLDALPPEIRAEVIQQEAIEQARRNQAARPVEAGTTSGAPTSGTTATHAADAAGAAHPALNPGAFLAGLDPGLREVVLMEQDEDFLSGLRPAVAAGLGLTGAAPTGGASAATGWSGRLGGAPAGTSKAKPVKRDAIQLLDKTGVASLARLLFFPGIFRKQNLLKILANLSENAKNRSDLINLLLAVLQDEGGDLAYIERQAMAKEKKALPNTPKANLLTPTPRKKPAPETPGGTSAVLGSLQSDSIPAFVAQRAFEGLSFIVSGSEQATIYFLMEHEVPIIARKSNPRKVKAKDRPLPQITYPIIVLMSLLARPAVLETAQMAESLTALLAALTKPLIQLDRSKTGSDQEKAKDSASTEQPSNTATTEDATVAASDTIAEPAPDSADVPVRETNTGGIASTDEEDPSLLAHAPKIPAETLHLVVNILTYGECSSRTFSHTLLLIQHLSHISDFKDAICSELRSQAQSIGDTVSYELRGLSAELAGLPGDSSAESLTMTKFTAASSAQAKLLRLLKTIDYMFAPKSAGGSGGWDAAAIASVAEGAAALSPEEEAVNAIFESFHYSPVWDALGVCLGEVQRKPGLISVMTVLLPLVESLMVVSKYSTAKTLGSKLTTAGLSPMSPMSPKESIADDTFFRFTNTHRKVLNIMVRNNPALMSGSFSLLVLNSRVLEFDNKRNWFTQQLRKKPSREINSGTIHLTVRRGNVFGDSYQALQRKSGDGLKYGKLSVKFHGEEGVDAGGVTREWYSILAREIFNPGYCLFEPCAADQLTYQPSQHSWVNESHLSYFSFVGKIIGKAIYDGRLLDAYFSRAFYKQMLGRKVDIRDLESVDPEYHKSLVWMLDNDITGIIDLDFSLEAEEFGEKKIIDLKPSGSTIPVTEANKEEYVRLVCEHRLESAIAKQVKAFLEGFYDIIPRKLISIFDPDQLELLISGISNIDVDELKNATQLHGWKNSDAEISWFWRALRSFSQEERARFLMFVTSSSRVPLGGFSQLQGSSGVQPFQIHKLYREDVLPSSATCFNELLLPSYSSYEALRARLLTAITEGSGHFGLA